MRIRLRKAPHRDGVEDGEADGIARTIVEYFSEVVEKHRNIRGGKYRSGMYSYGNHVLDGFYLGATPDGRKKGEPVSNGISPSNLQWRERG